MGMTPAQQAVVDARDTDLLVSAAAGSGKTTVLVERIIQKVCDKVHPVDIDRMLIVTFTRAAANEMKERIYAALSEVYAKDPSDTRLAAQMTLVFQANITTIDGFCQSVVRNYFHEIAVSPDARIAEEGELLLLSHEVIGELLEENYQKGEAAFLDFADAFAGRERDGRIEDMILSVYQKAITFPWMDEWLDAALLPYCAEDEKELLETDWMREMVAQAHALLLAYQREAKELLDELSDHPYKETLADDLAYLQRLCEATDYDTLYQTFLRGGFGRLTTKKKEGENLALRDAYRARRTRIKEGVEKLKKELFTAEIGEVYREMGAVRPRVETLILLVKEYHRRFCERKRDKNIMDFADIEHFALSVLVDPDTKEKTAAAVALSGEFDEVMIDEYQDTNLLQETILKALTGEKRHNYFMVGDVKQSIYRFREARPDIFMQKYDLFADGDGRQRIVLDCNFRSRREVCDAVNDVFFSLMQRDCGGIAYDRDARLVAKADYPEAEGERFRTELLIADATEAEEAEFTNDNELEATMIAMRIKELMRDGWVTDAQTKKPRRIRYADIALLHRSANANGPAFVDTLARYDIPAHMVSATGYFASVEVETVLALLSILNNPRADIPLTAVLSSPMFSFTKERLLTIRQMTEGAFHEAFFAYADGHSNEEDVQTFVAFLIKWRARIFDTTIADILSGVLKETGYLAYVTALPDGMRRRENLLKLIDLAITYEKSSYQGLFDFVRYIERLKSYEQDFGIAETVSEHDDAVHVMTVHKSKGLEFPVVFVAGLGRRLSIGGGTLQIHERMGIGMDMIDPTRRTKHAPLYKTFLSRMNRMDERGEELRVLYVAMTRAKEKLILCGVLKDAAKVTETVRPVSGVMDLSARLSAGSYMALLLPVAAESRHMTQRIIGPRELVVSQLTAQLSAEDQKENLCRRVDAVSKQDIAACRERSSYVYRHPISSYKNKYAVSEIKHRAMEAYFSGEAPESLFDEKKEAAHTIPQFLGQQGKEENIGALAGTAMHRYMECFDFTREDYAVAYTSERQRMLERGLLQREQDALLNERAIKDFLQSPLAERMHRAACAGRLYKEKAFVCGDTPDVFFDDAQASDDFVLVQGIIDAFFEEEDGIVLLDYKTDRVKEAEELIGRYRKQLMLYEDAIRRTHSLPVKEILIYSFTFGTIRI